MERTSAGSKEATCARCGAALSAAGLQGLCPACLLDQGVAADTGTQPERPPSEALPIEAVARLFPQLEIIALLGQGGMGAVYKARQPALDRLVALKILPRQAGASGSFAERFSREARALAKLSHPGIVAVHDFGQTEGVPWFLMEFVDGVTLRQLERTRRLTPREALQLIPQICDALQYAHDEGVVHRDIKPENVLVDRKGRVKIADFGLARILGAEAADLRLTGAGQVMGTPHYMAPEQVERPLEVDHRADIYALGVVFYEMLTGELPLGRFQPPSGRVPVDARFDDVVLRALEKEPALRYQQAGEVKTDVECISRSPAQAGPGVPPIPGSDVAAAAPSGADDSPVKAEGTRPSVDPLDPEGRRRLSDPERRRRASLWYGFIVSLIGVPVGFAIELPFVWGLGLIGIAVAGAKLGLWSRLGAQTTQHRTGVSPVPSEAPSRAERRSEEAGTAGRTGQPRSPVTSAPGADRNRSGDRLEGCPWVLWIALVGLLVAFLAKLTLGPRDNPWLAADVLLLLGLRLRLKAAWVATLFFALLGVLTAMAGRSSGLAIGVLALSAAVAVPVWLSTPWFFPGPPADVLRRRGEALRGLLFLAPPMVFTSALLGNVFDLDIDAQFITALAGLPIATGLGAALVWASTLLSPDGEQSPTSSPPWSWRAIGSAALLTINLPLAATALLTVRAIANESHWNPAPAEASFAIGAVGGGFLLALGSLLLGIMARRECQSTQSPRRGAWLAWAGTWFWPALLVAAFAVQVHRVEIQAQDRAVRSEHPSSP